jgi:hypothetical protein
MPVRLAFVLPGFSKDSHRDTPDNLVELICSILFNKLDRDNQDKIFRGIWTILPSGHHKSMLSESLVVAVQTIIQPVSLLDNIALPINDTGSKILLMQKAFRSLIAVLEKKFRMVKLVA